MTSLNESLKLLMKNYKRSEKKRNSLKTFPRCSSTSVEVAVMNSLDPIDSKRTKISEIGKFGREGYAHVIIHIKCPECKEILDLDPKWLAFICSNHDKRRIWEVVRVYERDGTRFK